MSSPSESVIVPPVHSASVQKTAGKTLKELWGKAGKIEPKISVDLLRKRIGFAKDLSKKITQRGENETTLINQVAKELHTLLFNPKEGHWGWFFELGFYDSFTGPWLTESERNILLNPDLRIRIFDGRTFETKFSDVPQMRTDAPYYDIADNTLYINPFTANLATRTEDIPFSTAWRFPLKLDSYASGTYGNLIFPQHLKDCLQGIQQKYSASKAISSPLPIESSAGNYTRARRYLETQYGASGQFFDLITGGAADKAPALKECAIIHIREPILPALLHAVASGGKKQAVQLLDFLGLGSDSSEFALKAQLLESASRLGNFELVAALVEVGAMDVVLVTAEADFHSPTKQIMQSIRNAITNGDVEMLELLLNSRKFDVPFLEKCILDQNGRLLIPDLEYDNGILQLLLQFGLNDCIATSVMKYESWDNVRDYDRMYRGHDFAYAHSLIKRFTAMGVDFLIGGDPKSEVCRNLVLWANNDPSGRALSLLIDNNPNIFEPWFKTLDWFEYGEKFGWTAANANNWELMKQVLELQKRFPTPESVQKTRGLLALFDGKKPVTQQMAEFLLLNGFDETLTVLINSGKTKVTNFEEVKNRKEIENFGENWNPHYALEHWGEKAEDELTKLSDLSDEDLLSQSAKVGNPNGKYLSMHQLLINRRFIKQMDSWFTTNEPFLRDIYKAISEGNVDKLRQYLSDTAFARSLRMTANPFNDIFWEMYVVQIAIENDDVILLHSLKEAGFNIGIPGAFGYAFNHGKNKVLRLLYADYLETGLLEGEHMDVFLMRAHLSDLSPHRDKPKQHLDFSMFTKEKYTWSYWRSTSQGFFLQGYPNSGHYRLDVQNYLKHLNSLSDSPLHCSLPELLQTADAPRTYSPGPVGQLVQVLSSVRKTFSELISSGDSVEGRSKDQTVDGEHEAETTADADVAEADSSDSDDLFGTDQIYGVSGDPKTVSKPDASPIIESRLEREAIIRDLEKGEGLDRALDISIDRSKESSKERSSTPDDYADSDILAGSAERTAFALGTLTAGDKTSSFVASRLTPSLSIAHPGNSLNGALLESSARTNGLSGCGAAALVGVTAATTAILFAYSSHCQERERAQDHSDDSVRFTSAQEETGRKSTDKRQ